LPRRPSSPRSPVTESWRTWTLAILDTDLPDTRGTEPKLIGKPSYV